MGFNSGFEGLNINFSHGIRQGITEGFFG